MGDRMENSKNIKNNGAIIIGIGLFVLLVIIARIPAFNYLNSLPPGEDKIGTATIFRVSVAIIGIVTFFGFVWLGYITGGPLALHKEGMRLAIVAAVVVVDLVLVSSVIFFTEGESDEAMSKLAESFMSQFHTIVGIVIASYFGASAYVQVKSKEMEGSGKSDSEDQGSQSS
jgi:hypothetical protein